jgi:hypothetical protein
MLPETSGDFAENLEQPTIVPIANRVSKITSNFVVSYSSFDRLQARIRENGQLLPRGANFQIHSLPAAALYRIAHLVSEVVLPGLREAL